MGNENLYHLLIDAAEETVAAPTTEDDGLALSGTGFYNAQLWFNVESGVTVSARLWGYKNNVEALTGWYQIGATISSIVGNLETTIVLPLGVTRVAVSLDTFAGEGAVSVELLYFRRTA